MPTDALQELPRLLNAKEVAAYLKLHEVTVVNLARRGKLPGFKVGREWRFRADDIRRWVEQGASGADTSRRRFDALWGRLRQRAEQSGLGPDDVPRLIQEVREARRRQKTTAGA